MGYMRHHAIVVTSGLDGWISKAHTLAKQVGCRVSGIVDSHINGEQSFLVAPDGSKEGWDISEEGDMNRAEFIAWLDAQRYEDGSSPLAWVEVQYGDDDRETKIIHHSDEKHRATPRPANRLRRCSRSSAT